MYIVSEKIVTFLFHYFRYQLFLTAVDIKSSLRKGHPVKSFKSVCFDIKTEILIAIPILCGKYINLCKIVSSQLEIQRHIQFE